MNTCFYRFIVTAIAWTVRFKPKHTYYNKCKSLEIKKKVITKRTLHLKEAQFLLLHELNSKWDVYSFAADFTK